MEDQSGAGGPDLCCEMIGRKCVDQSDVSASVCDLPVFCDSSQFTLIICLVITWLSVRSLGVIVNR